MTFPVFDLHCDTVNELISLEDRDNSSLRANQAHIDLERAMSLCGYAQCFACFTTSNMPYNPVDVFEKQLSKIFKEIEKNHDLIRLAYTADDIENNLSSGLMSAILTLEGTAGFGFDPALLEDLSKIGFRICSLGWNEKNPLTGSCVTGGGLTDRGREFVNELQRLGMIVDVSHISDDGFWDVMDITNGSVIATHSNSRNLCDVNRNLTDDMFRAICATGGVAGINLYPAFLGKGASIDTACDHVFHFLELDPEGKHIALGGDLDGIDALPDGFLGIQDYIKLSERLLERGLSENMIHDIFWNNALEVMRHVVQVD